MALEENSWHVFRIVQYRCSFLEIGLICSVSLVTISDAVSAGESAKKSDYKLGGGGWMIASTAWKVQALRVVCSRPNSVYVCVFMHARLCSEGVGWM